MPKNGRSSGTDPQGLYDRLADVQSVAMKLNGYRASVARFLRSLDLELTPESKVLDAGSGTGIVSMAFCDAAFATRRIIAADLSYRSLKIGKEEFRRKKRSRQIDSLQANILKMPFADDTFDLVIMCGVLEYVPLDNGLREAARVLRKGKPLVLLPVKPSIVGSVLELFYNFKIHPPDKVWAAATRYFDNVSKHNFPSNEPISWSKSIYLLEKK